MKKIIFILILVLLGKIYSIQLEDYPVIFIHGHGSDLNIESDTWKHMIEKNLVPNQSGYMFYDPDRDGQINMIYSESSKELKTDSLSPRTIFYFGYYRSKDTEGFGEIPGKIGAIPVPYTGKYPYAYYKNTDDGSPRISYTDRLSTVVDNVLRATGASKVILIGHSMGGLVARAYTRWIPGGSDKVYKILTIGTPNSGIPDDMRLWLEQHLTNIPMWEISGEDEELAKTLGNAPRRFGDKDFTEWLNDGWQTFCTQHNIQYATIRGNYDPYIVLGITIGDGVVDEDSAILNGAVFNAVGFMAHTEKLPTLSPINSGLSMLHSIYTSEIIKQWVFKDRVQVAPKPSVDNVIIASPFDKKLAFQYRVVSGNVVCAEILLYDQLQNLIGVYQAPAFLQQYLVSFDLSKENLSMGPYFPVVNIYDMNGPIYTAKLKTSKVSGATDYDANLPITIAQGPPYETSSSNSTFILDSNYSWAKYGYSIDGKPISNFVSTNKFSISGLSVGKHTITIYGSGTWGNAAGYSWLVTSSNLTLSNQTVLTQGRLFKSDNTITAGSGFIIPEKSGASFKAKREIRLKSGFRATSGSSFRASIE